MKEPKECRCNGLDHRIASTDAKLIRRVRKDTVERLKRYESEGADVRLLECVRWNAWCCLIRLRELRKNRSI